MSTIGKTGGDWMYGYGVVETLYHLIHTQASGVIGNSLFPFKFVD